MASRVVLVGWLLTDPLYWCWWCGDGDGGVKAVVILVM